LFFRVEIIHKTMVKREGDRGIESDSRDHSQIGAGHGNSGRIYLGGIVFTSEIIPKNSVKTGHNWHLARFYA